MKSLKKILKIFLLILAILISLFIINYLRINISYLISKDKYEQRIEIYGVKDNYVPQGITYEKEKDLILETAYNGNNKCSQLYVIDFSTGKLLKTLDLYEGENCSTGHVGGITIANDQVIITYDYKIIVYNLEDILNSDEIVNMTAEFEIKNRGDFCYYNNGMLWVGEFYLKPFYDLPDGKPLLYGYSIDYNLREEDFDRPSIIIKLPKMVQGMLITEKNEFVFSRSFTYLVNSKLTRYKNPEELKEEIKEIDGQKVLYREFTDDDIISEESIPPMSESMFYKEGKAYILFESNSSHYKLALPRIKKILEFKIYKN